MNITKKQLRRLIRQADRVEVDGFRRAISSYNLGAETGPALWLAGDGKKLAFSMSELSHATILDDYTLIVSGHHLVFIKLNRLKINAESGQKAKN